MEAESEPYVRLATMRQLHQAVADLNTARSLADTLQTVADGIVMRPRLRTGLCEPRPARR